MKQTINRQQRQAIKRTIYWMERGFFSTDDGDWNIEIPKTIARRLLRSLRFAIGERDPELSPRRQR